MSRDKSGEGRHHPLHDGAVLGIALALLLDSLIGQVASLVLFFGVVAAHAWSGGMRPGLLAATLVALVANHFLPESQGRSITHPIALALLFAYALEGTLAGTLFSALHDPRTRAETNARGSRQHRELSSWNKEYHRLFLESSPLSRERFLLLVEVVKDHAIFMLDPDGHFVSWSAGAERLTGYRTEEVLGRHASILYPVAANQGGEPESELAVAMAEGRCEGEGWRLHKEGSRFCVYFGISALRDEAGDLRGFAVVMRDVTERKRAEEKFRLVVESAPNAMVMVDRTGRIVLVNAQTEKLFGYGRGELLGQSVELLVPERFRGAHPDHRAGFYAHPEARAMGVGRDLSGRRKDGSEFPVEIGLNPIATDEGLLVLSAIVDITERRRAEEELRRARDELEVRVRQRTAELARANDALQGEIGERTRAEEALRTQSNVLRSILDNLPAAVIVVDEDERLPLSNPAAEQMFGHDTADASRPGWWRRHAFTSLDGVTPVAADALPLTRVIRGEELNDVEYFVRPPKRPEGVWISINGRPLRNGSGHPCGGLIVCRDVTELKRVAEALQEAKEVAEAANRAKDQFLAILSHELRTPLTPVLLAVSALLDETAGAAELRPSLEMIRRNIELEARLIDDLLDVARASSGRMSLQLKPVDAHAAIHEALAVCGAEVRGAGIRPTLELTAAAHHVNADPARLQQVLWNLIKNAVKFTPRGGSVALRTRNEEDRLTDPRGVHLIIEVSDSGIGIAPEDLLRIFNAFEQGSATLRRRYGGLGLGLAISRSVIEAHGGRLTAASAGTGRGSTFTFELATIARPTPALAPPPPAPEEPAPSRALRILLVEDNKETLKFLVVILGRLHTVRPAADLSSALELAAGEEFDLVLSDIELPDGSGLELMHELRKTRATPGIAMSGFGSEEDVRSSRSAGFAEHLTKPINYRTLEEAIQRVASRPEGAAAAR